MHMHHFGGVYADLDLVPLSDLSEHLPILNEDSPPRTVYLGKVGEQASDHPIPNAFMVSTRPFHPFWTIPLEFVRSCAQEWGCFRRSERLTGAVALKTCVNKWTEGYRNRWDQLEIVEPGIAST